MSQGDFFSFWKFYLPPRAKCSFVTMAVPVQSEWMCAFFLITRSWINKQTLKYCLVSRSIRLTAGGSERRTGASASSPKTTWRSCTLCSDMLCKFLCSYQESSEDFHFLQVFASEYHRKVTITITFSTSTCLILCLVSFSGSLPFTEPWITSVKR